MVRMPKRKIDPNTRKIIERELRFIMNGYPSIKDPYLRAKARSKVKKIMDDLGVTPYPGYHVLPDYMKE